VIDVVVELVMGVFWLAIIALIFYIAGRLVGLIYKMFIVLIIVAYPLVLLGTVPRDQYYEGIRGVVLAYPKLVLYVIDKFREALLAGDFLRFTALIVATMVVFVPFSSGIYDSIR
jgi:hypothetical protein